MIDYNHLEPCNLCDGYGEIDDYEYWSLCPECKGEGSVPWGSQLASEEIRYVSERNV